MAKFEIVPGLVYVDQETWGADPDHPRKGYKVGRDRRTHVIIHHTVMPDTSDTSPNLWETEQACRYLVKDFGTSESPKSTRQRDSRYAPT
ncbi:MAG: hypothetical protein KZQ65_08080, partial [Candidatus Thiodiazotropha sp. (ex Gloverina cf. vestifex)]|nr:hypothetical protein [Candidatus Thiodiazotropha sp. (ex Gloverina cf. vestifex)]